MFHGTLQAVDLLVRPGAEKHELEPMARAQIKEDWGDISYKLESIQHVHTGTMAIKNDDGADLGELNAELYFVYFKLLH